MEKKKSFSSRPQIKVNPVNKMAVIVVDNESSGNKSNSNQEPSNVSSSNVKNVVKGVFNRMEEDKNKAKVGLVRPVKVSNQVSSMDNEKKVANGLEFLSRIEMKIISSWEKELTNIMVNDDYSYMSKVPWQMKIWFDIIYENVLRKNLCVVDTTDQSVFEYILKKNFDSVDSIDMDCRNPLYETRNHCFERLNDVVGNILKSNREFFLSFKKDDENLAKWKDNVKTFLLESIYEFLEDTECTDEDEVAWSEEQIITDDYGCDCDDDQSVYREEDAENEFDYDNEEFQYDEDYDDDFDHNSHFEFERKVFMYK